MNTGLLRRPARAVLALSLAACLNGCSKNEPPAAQAGGPPQAPVRVSNAERRDLPLEIKTIGTTESLSTVIVRPQVSGIIADSPLVEGKEVRAGDVLVKLGARPFQAALSEAEARLESSRVRENDARRALTQLEAALQGRAVSERERDKAQADVDASAADVRMNEASVETARLRLAYCEIRSPLTGRAGTVWMKEGNVVKENETQIVQVSQIEPIGVSFAVPEQHLSMMRALQSAGPLSVEALPNGDSGKPVTGALAFIDNQVDPTTGTIRVRAEFTNSDRRLWPGQFVRVTLRLTVEHDVVVVPAPAVQTGQKGMFVFVVKDGTAEMREVRVSRSADGFTAIASGVDAGEQVVTDGQLRLLPGSRVQVKTEGQGA